jgi:hypothetical protein
MTSDDEFQAPPWEPPLAGTETEQVIGALDRLRMTFQWKAGGLDAAGLNTKIGASALTLGGLLKHLAFVEDYTFTVKFKGASPGPPWESVDWDNVGEDWIFLSAAEDAPRELYALWEGAVERSRARLADALADGGFDQTVHMGWEGRHANLRRLVCDLIEEYGRHTGHADLLRESVDGLVGEDPPDNWRP